MKDFISILKTELESPKKHGLFHRKFSYVFILNEEAKQEKKKDFVLRFQVLRKNWKQCNEI